MIGWLIQAPLEHYASNTPEHPALSFQGSEMSYRELDLASNQLAHALIANGVTPQERVGIFMHKGLNLGVAIYGILKAACVFVPLDPFMPVERLAFILRDCEIQHLISSNAQAGILGALDTQSLSHVYGLDAELAFNTTDWATINTLSTTLPPCTLIDQELGYIMYTSGTTGDPKGMMHTHHGSISYARWGMQHVNLQPEDRVASHAPLHFDLSIFDFFSTLQAGATVVLVAEQITRFPASWTKLIDDERISVVFTVPYTLVTMLEQGAMEKRDLGSLRWIMFGGEPFPPRQLRLLMQALPKVRFTNVYGPAEAPSCTCFNVTLADLTDDDPLPIGTVSLNSEGLIIDDKDEECAVGVPGELCIRSSTLTKGYWKRPDLNAEAFLLREGLGPFPVVFYRTGDRVVLLEDGQLRFLGRSDRMVKTRGHRVELDEVEAVLASHNSVLEVAAFVIPDTQGSQNIHAVVTQDADAQVDIAILLRYARENLPAYAVPREIEQLHELPHTSSGKIDRRAVAQQWQSHNNG